MRSLRGDGLPSSYHILGVEVHMKFMKAYPQRLTEVEGSAADDCCSEAAAAVAAAEAAASMAAASTAAMLLAPPLSWSLSGAVFRSPSVAEFTGSLAAGRGISDVGNYI